MSVDVNQLNQVLQDLATKVNALMAVTGGLAAQVYEAAGEEGLDRAQAKANALAAEISRPIHVNVDRRLIAQIFDNAKR